MATKIDLTDRMPVQKVLLAALSAIVFLHAVLLLALKHPVAASRLCTAMVPALAALCGLWRAKKIHRRERSSWWWLCSALMLWSAGQMVEVLLPGSAAASNLAADPADFLYIISAFPLLLAVASTAETESIGSLFALNLSQALLAGGLAYVLLFRTVLPHGGAVMQKIYAAECGLLALAATLRLVTWSTAEERRRVCMMCGVLWMYLPIELAMDFATSRWGLSSGTLLDLLWSLPFLYSGWRTLRMPLSEPFNSAPQPMRRNRRFLLLQSLCPLLITVGVFSLAASLTLQHRMLALTAMMVLLLIQGLHAGLIQRNYLLAQFRLLAQEGSLKQVNADLERLSWLDPLTGISNRRHFTAAFEAEWKRAMRRKDPMAILMIDVDHFKGVNDLHGHTYGDECLVRVSRIIRGELRGGSDLLARYGGEEFILLLPETGLEGALIVAERIRLAVNAAGIVSQASLFNQLLTVSIGVAAGEPLPELSPSAVLHASDQALYDAKRQGRNRVSSREYAIAAVPFAMPAVSAIPLDELHAVSQLPL